MAAEIDLKAFGELLKSRRTINFFEPQPAPVALLRDAIDVARWAPNHKVTEPWRFYLLGTETVRGVIELFVELAVAKGGESAGPGRRARLEGVPGWFAVTSALSGDALREREDYAACCCAVQTLMLYLWQAGVGVKWTTGDATREPRFYELIGADPARERVVGLFWYGYPKIVPVQKRRDADEFISQLR